DHRRPVVISGELSDRLTLFHFCHQHRNGDFFSLRRVSHEVFLQNRLITGTQRARSALPHSAFRVQGMGRFGVTVVKYARAIVYSPSAMRALSSADCLCLRAKEFGAGALTYRRTAAAFAGFFEIGRTDRARKPVGLSMLQRIQGRAPRPP